MATQIIDGKVIVTDTVVIGEWTQEQLQAEIQQYQDQITALQAMIAEKQTLLLEFE